MSHQPASSAIDPFSTPDPTTPERSYDRAHSAGAQSGLLRKVESVAAHRTFGDITPALVHDLKGPLSAITMNVDFALDQLPSGAELEHVKSALEDCRSASARLFRMISNLLDVARIEEGRLRPNTGPIAVAPLLGQIVESYAIDAAMRRVDVALEVDDEVGVVESDSDLLTRVLQSIIDNALRHTRARGHITVAARRTADRAGVEIRIGNDGASMAPDVRARLFQRNLGDEANGAGANRGLGLYFCRLAVEAMSGTLTLVDEPGCTVCFAIALPSVAPATR